ncbi:ParB N-terminal domain-containing protein [Paracoccus sp. JM45]|uniref:ParB/RepB/Spo0J family partition protein n=1 Tax=Paracoccus sp. JM45 TaxID=2283626 RepID=UPI000E6BA421|nr:ParB N-terminal domain-containing protein [Paracoccus sp. JM45]RJE78805.1 replication protein [Paracoccus sp. JM45]
MSRKRRVFDIDIPDNEAEDFPAGKIDQRRGPMAAAIVETAESTRDRAVIEAQIRAENDALASEHVRLKRAGLITDVIALDLIDTKKLSRDRQAVSDPELDELVTSIGDIGLSNPIQVEPTGDGRYELIQGWRRLSAYRQLLKESNDVDKWGKIPAGIAVKGDQLEQLYRRMVDENLVRKDISFAEMAQLALSYATDPLTIENDAEKAVAILFKSAGYQKRSYIRNFIPLVQNLGGVLLFSQEIPRALGLSIAQRIQDTPDVVTAIKAELDGWDKRTAREELDILKRYATQIRTNTSETASDEDITPTPTAKAKTTFQLRRPQGSAKCSAANGRLEIRLARDFSTVDRRRLEAAVSMLLDQID